MEKVIVPLHLLPAAHLLLDFKYSLLVQTNPVETEGMKKIICSDKLIFV